MSRCRRVITRCRDWSISILNVVTRGWSITASDRSEIARNSDAITSGWNTTNRAEAAPRRAGTSSRGAGTPLLGIGGSFPGVTHLLFRLSVEPSTAAGVASDARHATTSTIHKTNRSNDTFDSAPTNGEQGHKNPAKFVGLGCTKRHRFVVIGGRKQ